jgi:hypothetical protein
LSTGFAALNDWSVCFFFRSHSLLILQSDGKDTHNLSKSKGNVNFFQLERSGRMFWSDVCIVRRVFCASGQPPQKKRVPD